MKKVFVLSLVLAIFFSFSPVFLSFQTAVADDEVALPELITQDTIDASVPSVTMPIEEPPAPELPKQIDKTVFTPQEQDSVLIHLDEKDGSTNIAFYIPYGDDAVWTWQSETPAIGDKAFLDYWAPTPAPGKYIGIEYKNDDQQFSCSGLSLDDCLNDPHFISKFNFEISE